MPALPVLIVGGISLSGKTCLAAELRQQLNTPVEVIEGDDLHEPRNIEKMGRGEPLDETDRTAWRTKIEQLIAHPPAGRQRIVTCSALSRGFRDALRRSGPVRFVLLEISRATADERAARRERHDPDHFFRARTYPQLLDGQYRDYQRPAPDETDTLAIDADQRLRQGGYDMIAAEVAAWLSQPLPPARKLG